MGISIWQIIMLILFIIYPLLVMIFENTQNTISRKTFVFWTLGVLLINIISALPSDLTVVIVGQTFFGLVFMFFFFRCLVWRARDAGISKRLTYVAAIPIVNLWVIIYLCFKKPPSPYRDQANVAGEKSLHKSGQH